VQMPGASLAGLDLRAPKLGKVLLVKANMSGCVLRGVQFRKMRMDGCRLEGADLREANLEGAILDGAYMSGVEMRSTRMRNASLVGAVLADADISGCDLILANLTDADCTRTDLRFTRLVGAECRKAHFQWADLRNADFTNAVVSGASFWGARMMNTKLPMHALFWKVLVGASTVFIAARRKREERQKRDHARRIRDTVRLVERLEAKDPRLRRIAAAINAAPNREGQLLRDGSPAREGESPGEEPD